MKISRVLMSGTGRNFVQEEPGMDVNCQFGLFLGTDIDAAQDGDVVKSNTGQELVVFTPSWIDHYKKIRREAQIITFKDAGVILATTGLGPQSTVIEAGSGSGALTAFLAQHCKHVHSYDIKAEHLAIAQENAETLGLNNITFSQHDVAQGLPAKDVDAIILDMPEPWHALTHVPKSLNIGGFLVTYVPSTTQLQKTHEEAEKIGLMPLRIVEVSERHWMVRGQAVRPTSKNVAFTAFLSFYRWMGPHWPGLRPKERQPTPGWTLPEEGMEDLF